MPVITYDADAVYIGMKIIKMHKAAKRAIAYYKCIQEAGGGQASFDDNLKCLGINTNVEMPNTELENPDFILKEVLAQIPEGEKETVISLLINAQNELIEKYIGEMERTIP